MPESVILVDQNDIIVGKMEKHDAHKKGVLHRAFSIFIVNRHQQLLLQKRAHHKYHSGGLWSNTCCSHPRPGEKTLTAAKRRLKEEMGFECRLEEQFKFIYKTTFNNHLSEYEYDHVYFGSYGYDPHPDPEEVADWKWMDLEEISEDLKIDVDAYTYWFKMIWCKTADLLESYCSRR